MFQIDINCDLGESFGVYKIGFDEEILDYVIFVNIVCGFYVGDFIVMCKIVVFVVEKGVKIGVYFGLFDFQGFGWRQIVIMFEEVYDLILY